MTDSSINTAEPMIVVDHVDMIFNIANQQLNSLKEYLIALVRQAAIFPASSRHWKTSTSPLTVAMCTALLEPTVQANLRC